MTISNAMSIAFRNEIRIYPIITRNRFKVAVSFNGKQKKVFDKELSGKELNEALTKTYIYYANKLK